MQEHFRNVVCNSFNLIKLLSQVRFKKLYSNAKQNNSTCYKQDEEVHRGFLQVAKVSKQLDCTMREEML